MFELKGRQYSSNSMTQAINLFLESRSADNSFKSTLTLPHPDTLKSLCGKFKSPGSIKECDTVINSVFLKACKDTGKIIFDAIHIRPGVQYQGCHILGFSETQPEKPGRTNLAIMTAPLMGDPPFVLLLVLIHCFT